MKDLEFTYGMKNLWYGCYKTYALEVSIKMNVQMNIHMWGQVLMVIWM